VQNAERRRRNNGWGLGCALFAASLAAAAAGQDPPAKPEKPSVPSASKAEQDARAREEEAFAIAAEEVTVRVCAMTCHGIDRIERMRRTPRDWDDQVRIMAERGAMATEDQLVTIRKYLARYYGLVAVNTASAAELSAVLGLSPKDAAAIVEYRTAHGRFADAEALLKVPGIDRTKIDEQPDALRFN
jgi:competence ComEA-like helix-hairpin-helix protein